MILKDVYINDGCKVVHARISSNCFKEKFELGSSSKIFSVTTKNTSQAFLIACALNNIEIGYLWEKWSTLKLPWTVYPGDEFVYDVEGYTVARFKYYDLLSNRINIKDLVDYINNMYQNTKKSFN